MDWAPIVAGPRGRARWRNESVCTMLPEGIDRKLSVDMSRLAQSMVNKSMISRPRLLVIARKFVVRAGEVLALG